MARRLKRPGWSTPVLSAAVLALVLSGNAQSDHGQCSPCHSEVVEGYLRTGMGRSMQRPAPGHPTGIYRHGLSGTVFEVSSSTEGLVHVINRAGLNARYPVEFVIGSGNAAFGYLVRDGGAVFQSPLTYYTEPGRWGMAPGKEREATPDFDRPVTDECLWCHAGRPLQVPGKLNTYEGAIAEPAAISCERCHGPTDRHLLEPGPGTVFNPARAPTRQRDSVCEQCHLAGVVRVLNPGKSFGSFQPGNRLEDHWSVFLGVTRDAPKGNRFQVVSHVEQLALSQCAKATGDRFWCGTCHDPHFSPAEPRAYFSERCTECHERVISTEHSGFGGDCVSCHMPRRQSHDSGHSAFTDHRIVRRPVHREEPPLPEDLEPWKAAPAPLGPRNAGIAYVLQGQTQRSPSMVRRGLELLSSVQGKFSQDVALLDALGTALLLEGSPRRSVKVLEQGVSTGRGGALQFNALAAAWWELGNRGETVAALEEAIRLEPSLDSSYRLLAQVYKDLGQVADEVETWRRLARERHRLIDVRLRIAREDQPPRR